MERKREKQRETEKEIERENDIKSQQSECNENKEGR